MTGRSIANSQCFFPRCAYSESVLCKDCGSKPEEHKAGELKPLGRILVPSTKMDGNVPRRASPTNWPGVPATTASP